MTIYSGDALELFNQGLTTFLNEANRIQHLENPKGIAKVYDCVAENDTGYVISEYVEGQTLKELMESKGKFSWQEAKDFVSQILEGLSLVHPMDIIHCDIKDIEDAGNNINTSICDRIGQNTLCRSQNT